MYDTDQEQIEALQKWWSKNGNWVVGGFIIFIAAYVGVQLYQNSTENHRLEASAIYEELSESLASGAQADEKHQQLIDELKDDYADLGYGIMAALLEAKISVEEGDLDSALTELDWALDNADKTLTPVILYRKAQVLYALDELDDALTALNAIEGEGHQAVSYELKGDILLEQGKVEDARAAYQTASDLAESQSINNPYLKIKLDDLAVAE
ncbi:YfgM family protein [Reinekea marinisedimentorum]|uniref:Ancillary SecYEG translocon subunit n=1 Tax=Reinekea marinisedimentorum TaxID=230495 RepID=A0A4R3I786_9GAMM|nr:tetratricopeptide repeat protein [Reinekea marinisedimentorum]TCS42006.1 putative negative regulator of RcsB-dependent stress response [Reinekea marinisedimentorum]